MIDIQPLRFTANARLKDIIGRGLIYDDNIAILELVKNSKDAGSPDVSIKFVECEQNVGEPKLIIADSGSGMSFDDIKNKWLNIAYSDKRNAHPADGQFYAGSKGIGRFSCDRLGKTLDIYTRARGSDIIALHHDWEDYEIDDRNSSIGDIDVQARYLTHDELESETGLDDFPQGTAIVVRNLRSNWTKERLLLLRKELEKFAIDPDGEFQVSLSDWRFDAQNEVNQPIENKVFTDIDVRTTSISAKIDGDGSKIEIELRHDGDYIFKVQEENPYSEIKGLEAKLADLPFSDLLSSEKRDVSKLIRRMTETVSIKDQAIDSLKLEDEQRKKKLNAEKKRRLFAERFYTKDNEKLAQINHQVSLLSLSSIQKIDRIIRRFREDSSRYTSEALIEVLNDIRFTSRKINKVSNLSLMANFDLTCDSVKEDLIQFIEQYLKSFTNIQDAYGLNISVSNPKKVELPLHFRPAEMTILVDNLLANAGKARAKKIDIQVEAKGSVVKISFVDDGIGLTEKYSPKDLFENGVTTTSGTGIGLHHVQQIVEELGGRVSIRNGRTGAIVELEFSK